MAGYEGFSVALECDRLPSSRGVNILALIMTLHPYLYLDILTSCNYICARVMHKSVLLWGEMMLLEQRQNSRSTMIITVGDHLTLQTGSVGKYVMRPACSVLTLCERQFHSVSNEEKLVLITDTNILSGMQRPLLLLLCACRA